MVAEGHVIASGRGANLVITALRRLIHAALKPPKTPGLREPKGGHLVGLSACGKSLLVLGHDCSESCLTFTQHGVWDGRMIQSSEDCPSLLAEKKQYGWREAGTALAGGSAVCTRTCS